MIVNYCENYDDCEHIQPMRRRLIDLNEQKMAMYDAADYVCENLCNKSDDYNFCHFKCPMNKAIAKARGGHD